MNIPTTTMALVLPEYNANVLRAMLSLQWQEMPLPKLKDHDLLIEVEASPINPSDLAFMQGAYNIVKALPAIPGFEATGRVVATGKESTSWLGKRVSCFSQDEKSGCWAKHLVSSTQNCFQIPEDISLQESATLIINPLTAIGMFEMAQKVKAKTIVMNAAGGRVPALIRVLAAQHQINTLNIFRKKPLDSILAELRQEDLSLISSDENFEQDLKAKFPKEEPVIIFDAVGGLQSGLLFNLASDGSQLVLYGGLSNQALGNVDVLEMIFHRKSVVGFNLNDYIAEKNHQKEREELFKQVLDLVQNPKYSTKIQGEFTMKDASKGIKTYIKNMSAGKVLLIP